MEGNAITHRVVLRLLFTASLASLSYEITLIRIFSISLWYHFAFMVISIAMLGIGASGTALTLFPAMKNLRAVPWYALLLAVAIPASYLLANAVPFDPARLAWDRSQLFAIGLYYLILCAPFFFFGLIASTAYASMPRESNAIYASDLLGAGAGALFMVWVLSLGGPETGGFIISALLAAGLLVQAERKTKTAALALLLLNTGVVFLHPAWIDPAISPYKPFAQALQFPDAKQIMTTYSPYARVDLFKSPAVRFTPGLSFTYLDPLPEQTGISIDAGELYAITDESDRKSLAFVRSLPSSLVYLLGQNEEALIIEPRSGLSLITARESGAQSVTAIDSIPLVVKAVRSYQQTSASALHEGETLTGLGRTWLFSSGRKFDVIDLSLMGSWPSAAFGFAEDYRFTVEAFQEYLTHLKPDGFLSLNLYIIPPPRMELRLLATLATCGEELGMNNFSRHVAAIRSWDTLTMIVKKSVLTQEDIGRIREFTERKKFDLVYYPGIRPEESNVHIRMAGNEYAEAFRLLVNHESRDRFMGDYLFDIRPVSDERPFFHYYLKLENLKTMYRVMGEKWQFFIEEGYLLPVLLAQVFVVSTVLILLPLVVSKRKDTATTASNTFRLLSYFALLGLGYLFIEIVFIQKMILSLENPSYAASAVISSTLISSGIGSLLSRKFTAMKSSRSLLILAGLVMLSSFALSAVMSATSHHPLPVRIMLSFLFILPAGILMGIPFPLGISLLESTSPHLIPWAWAVNGCFSVLSPILAVMLALYAGYHVVLISGAALYVLAYGLIRGK